MKKILAILCVILGILGLCACGQTEAKQSEEDDEIAVAYAELHNGNASDVVYKSYGEFDGTNVLIISFKNSDVGDAERIEVVDGVDFYFNVWIKFDVYHDGAFYTLQEAFNNSWLTHEDLLTVRSNHRAANEKFYEDYEEEKETTKSPVVLEDAIKREIIAAFVEAHKNDKYPLSEEEISLRCFGAFDGAYVLFVDVKGLDYDTAIWKEVVADSEFMYSNGQRLTVYFDGSFYTLIEAYENGILSSENLQTAQWNYNLSHNGLH